jgi:hypothetical protein
MRDCKKQSVYSTGAFRLQLLATGIVFAALLVFVIYFINQEHLVYFWDSAGYWLKFREFGAQARNSLSTAFDDAIFSVKHWEYNLFPIILLLPLRFALGDSRISYIVSVTILFIFPFIVVFAYYFKSRVESQVFRNNPWLLFTLALFCLGFSPQLWVPVLFGYLDGGGLVLAMAVLVIYSRRPLIIQSYFNIFAMAFLLCLMVLFRRWFAYWVVGFLVSITIENIIYLARTYNKNLKTYITVFAKLFLIGGGSASLFFLFAAPIAKVMLLTDYSELYSGYKKAQSIKDIFQDFAFHFGFFMLLSAGLGFIFSLRHKENSSIALILFFQFWCSLFLFLNTQDMGYHHYYLVLPVLLYFSCYCLFTWLELLRNNILRRMCFAGMLVIFVLNFSIVFCPQVAASLQKVSMAFPKLRYFPEKRQDIEELHQILSYLDGLDQTGESNIYVLASSGVLNDAILRNACITADRYYSVCDRIVTAAHVDKRDGLPLTLFQSKYIVTTDSMQLHLSENDQQVVGKMRDAIVGQSGFGKNYRQLPVVFMLEKHVKAYAYERSSDMFNRDDLLEISDYFVKLYPAQKEKFLFPPELLDQLTK